MIEEVLFELAEEGRRAFNRKSGFDAPVVYRAMGEEAAHCAEGSPVQTIHSTCVLSFHADKRRVVQEFYAQAAEEPQESLCCPSGYSPEDTSHIPQEVLDRAYGCGSPVGLAEVREGEVVLDLGSGAGIDCFIAARKTGPSGVVIGLDMTDRMLEIAADSRIPVAENLGYDVVRFVKGFMESIPLRDKSVDLITSNCVINLSPDKKRVFREMWRVLKDHGRIVVSDVVAQGEVPEYIRANERLWGECIGGALSEEDFFSFLEQAGFYGLQTLKKSFYKEVDGYRFYSITVRAYKFEKREGCVYIGQKAVYYGPFKAVVDEEGHFFPRGEAVEVCTDTAEKLCNSPYQGLFAVTDPDHPEEGFSCCDDECCA
jgi:ubiquinone/menaquinone biosynthesis C-methylase UbiE